MDSRTVYLLTGSNGVLGTEFRNLAYDYDMQFIPLTRQDFDITNSESVLRYFKIHPELFDMNLGGIIHCAAYTNVPKAETPEGRIDAIDCNIYGTQNISQILCGNLGTKMIYISTDYVYPGHIGNYKETDKTQPINFYALTKLAGEAYAQPWKDLVIRTSFKPNIPWPYPGAFKDLYTSADYVDVIAPKILELVQNNQVGIFNVGTERKSIYDLAIKRNQPYNLKPISVKEIKDVCLPSDISMNLDKFNLYYDERYKFNL